MLQASLLKHLRELQTADVSADEVGCYKFAIVEWMVDNGVLKKYVQRYCEQHLVLIMSSNFHALVQQNVARRYYSSV